jgi:hypothetical protein
MKYVVCISLVLLLFSCQQQQGNQVQLLQREIDSLQAQAYKPGLGEFMLNIQIHHAKLWFAGMNKNWKLANFEIDELKENISGIQKYCTDRVEIKSIDCMIRQPIDSLSYAVQQQNVPLFKQHYIALTEGCNACHQATKHEFNVIKIPDNPPFSNQNFTHP